MLMLNALTHLHPGRRPFGAWVSLLLWTTLGALLLGSWLGGVYGPIHRFTLEPADIAHDGGCSYSIRMPRRPLGWPLTAFAGDDLSRPRSHLSLLEDGQPMPNPHATDVEMRGPGLAAYSHWRAKLLFSTADCSDPRANGRRYDVAVPWSPSGLSYSLGGLFWVYLGFLLNRRCAKAEPGSSACRAFRATLDALFTTIDLCQHRRLAGAVAVALVVACCGVLIRDWSLSHSVVFSLAGFYPVSDASGYWGCANALVDNGSFGYPPGSGDWCQRRAIYPTYLAGLSMIGFRHLYSILIIQALMIAAVIFVLIQRLSASLPVIAVAVCAGLLVVYGADELFPVTMTENAGIVFGTLALALLLRAAEERSLIWLMAGCALMSLALNARAGAFFILPALVLWSGLVARLEGRRIWLWVAATGASVLAGFAVQTLLVLVVGGDLAASHGNFSYTLYGLSVGGKGWSQVLSDHPELAAMSSESSMSAAIYELAWRNMVAQPALFLEGLNNYWSAYRLRGTYGFDRLGELGPVVKLVWWLAWIPLLMNCRDPRYQLIALLSLGIAASAPWLSGDGGARIFAATVAVDATQIAIGVGAFIALAMRISGAHSATLMQQHRRLRSPARLGWEGVTAILALAVLLLPHTPLRQLAAQPTRALPACETGQEAVVTRMNRGGTVAITILDQPPSAGFVRGQVDRQDLIQDIPRNYWWRADLAAFGTGTLLRANQLGTEASARPGAYLGYTEKDLTRFDGKLVGLCLDNHQTQPLFGERYRKLQSITLME